MDFLFRYLDVMLELCYVGTMILGFTIEFEIWNY